MLPTKFEIKGLFGNRNISIPIEGNSIILVGPNGIGKSSVVNIFYFFISRQWGRLIEYDFDEVAVWFGEEEVRAAKSDITGLSQISNLIREISPSSRMHSLIEKLRAFGMLEDFLTDRKMKMQARQRYSEALGVSPDDIRHLQYSLFRRVNAIDDGDLFAKPRIDIEQQLSRHITGRTLYLPTYRRIEKDLREISPALEEQFRVSLRENGPFKFSRSSKYYVDLVSFGMDDVRSNVEKRTRALRDHSLARFNELSALYLRDVIRGNADQYSSSQIATLNEDSLSVILGRVSEHVLSHHDKELLRSRILGMRSKQKIDMEPIDLYLAHYFSRLMDVSSDISEKETDISSFVEACNAYLKPAKQLVYDDTKFTVTIVDDRGRPLDLSMLSSGEKQVVSLFSHLYLDEVGGQVVIIDEPELSLSVPWQKRFLQDILDSNRCQFLVSVTHSPFIYQNGLRSSAIDLRKKTTVADR